MSRDCVFCKIIAGEIQAHKIYEDEKTLAFLDIHPSALGHTLIIPKSHVSRVEDLSQEDADSLFSTLHKLVKTIQESVQAPASTIGINNGRESGQEIPHVHIHIIPRFPGDRGGIIQGIARPIRRVDPSKLSEVAEKIRKRVSY